MDGEQASPECPGCRAFAKQVAALEAKVAELTQIIEELRRAGKRQAGPFSKGLPKRKPKRPGRKPGDEYGAHFSRPQPKQIHQTHAASLPPTCPHSGVPTPDRTMARLPSFAIN
jgi:transposase